MMQLQDKFPDNAEAAEFIAGPFTGYRFKRRGIASQGGKVIYDCKAIIDGQVVPETEAYYQTAVLGTGSLLPDFEKGLLGMKAGRVNQFSVAFPNDYGNTELAGRTALFQVFLHQVMEPVIMHCLDDLQENAPQNIYRFNNLEGVRKQNENLYYLVLRDSLPQKLMQEMTDYLSLVNFYLRLGFRDRAEALVDLLPGDPSTLEHAGRILLANNWPEKAHEILRTIAESSTEAAINYAKALIKMKQLDEADTVVSSASLSHDVQALDLRVGLASLRQQPIEKYLARLDDLLERQISYM